VHGSGYDSDRDGDSERVFWIAAESREQVLDALVGTDATFWGEAEMDEADIHYTLPLDREFMRDDLLSLVGVVRKRHE